MNNNTKQSVILQKKVLSNFFNTEIQIGMDCFKTITEYLTFLIWICINISYTYSKIPK